MELSDLPGWGQGGIALMCVSIITIVVFRLLSGKLATRREVDAVQKTADMFKDAWRISQENQTVMAKHIQDLGVLINTFTHYLDSLPKVDKGDDDATTPPR